MKIAIIEPGRTFEIPQREISDAEQQHIARQLAAQGIHVSPVEDIFHVLHLWFTEPCTTRQEVRTVAAFRAATDCRLACHKAVAPC